MRASSTAREVRASSTAREVRATSTARDVINDGTRSIKRARSIAPEPTSNSRGEWRHMERRMDFTRREHHHYNRDRLINRNTREEKREKEIIEITRRAKRVGRSESLLTYITEEIDENLDNARGTYMFSRRVDFKIQQLQEARIKVEEAKRALIALNESY